VADVESWLDALDVWQISTLESLTGADYGDMQTRV
tara:strand:+ start:415 stop:519 length:105 start_codon:yes stop_codon:yes gene_type:complete